MAWQDSRREQSAHMKSKRKVVGRKNRLEISLRTYKSGNDSRRIKYQRRVLQTREGVKECLIIDYKQFVNFHNNASYFIHLQENLYIILLVGAMHM
jgi:hypothetical protein